LGTAALGLGLGGLAGAGLGGIAGAGVGGALGASLGVLPVGFGLGNTADEFIQAGLTRGDNAPSKPAASVADFM